MSGERALADFALQESVCINVRPFPHAVHKWAGLWPFWHMFPRVRSSLHCSERMSGCIRASWVVLGNPLLGDPAVITQVELLMMCYSR